MKTVVRHLPGNDVAVVVRALDGVFDTRRTDGRWSCSCGQPAKCSHVRRAIRELGKHGV